MIFIYGTSHVSKESIELIDEKIEEHDPDIVALELDMLRLEALKSGEGSRGGPLFIRLVKMFQDYIGKRTGVMPGDEMLYAYYRAISSERDVALIDQDIRRTIQRLGHVRRKEKVKAGLSAVLGVLKPGSELDVSRIPEKDMIDMMVEELEKEFPELHQVLLEERNWVMAHGLDQLQQENPEKDIIAFVGAAHVDGIREELDNAFDSESVVEQEG